MRDRIIDFRRVPARDLLAAPKNWRTHPPAQAAALRAILSEVGIADAAIARQTPEGLVLVDGHLRREVAPEAEWPVLVLDVSEAEADKLLAVLDPLAALAEANGEKLDALLGGIEFESEALRSMTADLRERASLAESAGGPPPRDVSIPECFQVVVECEDETQQKGLYERLVGEGYKCRVLTV